MPRCCFLLVAALLAGCSPPRYTAPDPEPRATAADGPLIQGKPLSAWVRDLESKDVNRRRSAAAFLGDAGNKQVVPHLLKAMKDPEAEVREAAARSLGIVGPTAKEALQPLIGALNDGDDKVKGAAADALGNFKDDAKPAVAALVGIWKGTKNNDLRARAAIALNKIDRDAARQAGVPQP